MIRTCSSFLNFQSLNFAQSNDLRIFVCQSLNFAQSNDLRIFVYQSLNFAQSNDLRIFVYQSMNFAQHIGFYFSSKLLLILDESLSPYLEILKSRKPADIVTITEAIA